MPTHTLLNQQKRMGKDKNHLRLRTRQNKPVQKGKRALRLPPALSLQIELCDHQLPHKEISMKERTVV